MCKQEVFFFFLFLQLLTDRAPTKQAPAHVTKQAPAHIKKEGKENIYFIA